MNRQVVGWYKHYHDHDKMNTPAKPNSMRRLSDRRNNTLLHQDPGLRCLLERLLGHPLGADGQAEGALVLEAGLVGVGELGGHVLVVLFFFVSYDTNRYVYMDW